MSDDNMGMNAEYAMRCEKCRSEYPMGTSYCTNPLCRANLAIYGKIIQKNAVSDVDAACKKIEQMMGEVLSALSGKSYEAEKRPKYQDRFMRIMESTRTAKSNASLQNNLQQAEQWKETCLNEISLLGENLEGVRAQARERISRAREAVMSALAGKRQEQEKRKEYGAQYDALWTKVNNSVDSNEIKNCAMRAENLTGQFLAEISRLSQEDDDVADDGRTTDNGGTTGGTVDNGGTTGGATDNGGTTDGDINKGGTDNGGTADDTPDRRYAAKLLREKQRTQKRINAAMDKVLKALSKKRQGDQYRDKYAVGFKNISAQMQRCRILEEIKVCAVQAEALRDSDLIEIKGMKNKFGVVKPILLVLLILFVLGFIGGVVTGINNLPLSSSQENKNLSAETEKDTGIDDNNGNTGTEDDTEADTDHNAEGNWEENVLMSDFYGWNDEREETDWPVFDSDEWVRGDITSIIFLDTLDSEGADSWDVSEAQDGSVKAWVEESRSDTILYIAGDGGVSAPEDSEGLFVGYGAVSIEFGSAFHTDAVKDMCSLFTGCTNLQTVDFSGFNTSKVKDMSNMFSSCHSLEKLDLTGLDTSKVTDMSGMFCFCFSLKEVDVTGFDTLKVTDMRFMFSGCMNLQTVDLSGFDFSNVTTTQYMFAYCYELSTIGNAQFDFSDVADTKGMFDGCDSLDTSNLTGY